MLITTFPERKADGYRVSFMITVDLRGDHHPSKGIQGDLLAFD